MDGADLRGEHTWGTLPKKNLTKEEARVLKAILMRNMMLYDLQTSDLGLHVLIKIINVNVQDDAQGG